MSKRDAKEEAEESEEEEEEEEEDDDELSDSREDNDDEESGSEDELSESENGDEKATPSSSSSKGSKQPPVDKGKNAAVKMGSERSLANQPFDEAVDLSESEDMSEAGKDSPKKKAPTSQLKNLPFDEALELSASAQDLESPVKKPQPLQAMNAIAETGGKTAGSTAPSGKPEVKNRPFDEEVDLSDSGESIDTNGPSSPDKKSMKAKAKEPPVATVAAAKPKDTPPPQSTLPKKEEKPRQEERKASPVTKPAPVSKQPEKKVAAPEPKRKVESSSSEEEESDEEEEDEEEEDDDDEEEEEEEEETPPPKQQQQQQKTRANGGGGGASAASPGANSAAHAAMMASAGPYKESDFAHLKVSNEVKELFQYIGRFKPQEIELETRLKCFIPEYIPAVGDMDAFLKIPRPDGEPDHLGLKMLDEPSLQQSDATVLDLQLRSTSKKKHGDIVVRSIENAEKTPKEIDKWIKSIADLHRTKPPPQVHYTKPMPDIESLMQVWPEEFEELLSKTQLPSASMDMALEQYIRVICAILDIPVYKNVFESLHVLFTLYLEFRSNQHFMNYDEQLEGGSNTFPNEMPYAAVARRELVSAHDDYPSSRK